MNNDLQRIAVLEAQMELARRDFFYFCQFVAPDFYKPDRTYQARMCAAIQDIIETDERRRVLIINAPPRHGKSRTAQLATAWAYGQDPALKIMTGSYNETLSTTFSKNVRNMIGEVKADPNRMVYSDLFPDVRIKKGDAAQNLWSLDGGYNSYLATSPGGTATGFGADILMIDDLIKNAEEAFNEGQKARQWAWFTDTMLSRLEGTEKMIIIMTRWASDDLAGKVMEELPKAGYKVDALVMKALQDDGTMLCDDILDRQSYEARKTVTSPEIVAANYDQDPIDIQGRLYREFKTYTTLPEFIQIRAYVDTADTGADYLCMYVYGVTRDLYAYILDVIYTKDPMEITEPQTAHMLIANRVNVARIESNNGGRAFARNVRSIMWRKGHRSTIIKWFHQSKNKLARIYSHSFEVQERVLFPDGWHIRWPELHRDLTRYTAEGRNEHDDAPDALTGVVENLSRSTGPEVLK